MTLFLDVDGILNILSKSYTTKGYSVEPHLVGRLTYLIEQCDIDKIVVTSAWGKSIKQELEAKGFKYCNLITAYIHDVRYNRGDIIKDFVVNNNIDEYIILEDEPYMFENKIDVDKHLIQVDFKQGLSDANVDRAILLASKQYLEATERG